MATTGSDISLALVHGIALKQLSASEQARELRRNYKFIPSTTSPRKKAVEGKDPEASLNVTGQTLVDFQIFAQLPGELQDHVWMFASFMNPHTIQVIATNANVKLVGTMPEFPHILHATSGSRHMGLCYYEVFESFDQFGPDYMNPLGFVWNVNGAPAALPAGQQNMAVDPSKVVLHGAFPVKSGNVTESLPSENPGVRKHYINFGAVYVKLHFGNNLGDVNQYLYPTFNHAAAGLSQMVKTLPDDERLKRIVALQQNYATRPDFLPLGDLPSFLQEVENLVLDLSLPPNHNVKDFTIWASNSIGALFDSSHISTIIRQFKGLKSVDFYIPGDHKLISDTTKMKLKHWQSVKVQNSDGLSLSSSQMGSLEIIMEQHMGAIRRETFNGNIKTPRLLVYVPEKGGNDDAGEDVNVVEKGGNTLAHQEEFLDDLYDSEEGGEEDEEADEEEDENEEEAADEA